MTLNELTQIIINSSLSRSDIHRRLRLIREYLEKKYFSGTEISLDSCIQQQGGSARDIEVMQTWGEEFWSSFPKDKAYKMLSEMENKIKTYPSVSLYVPKELDSSEQESMGNWVRKTFETPPLLDIRIDPTLIVGCAVASGGYYREYSLRYFLDQKREGIKQILEQFSKVT